MRGQVWPDYVLVLAGVILVAVGALAHVYQPSIDSIICTTAYMRAQSEITRQEFNTLTDYSVYVFNCKRDGDTAEVNIVCKCADHTRVDGAVQDELSKFGITDLTTNVKYIR